MIIKNVFKLEDADFAVQSFANDHGIWDNALSYIQVTVDTDDRFRFWRIYLVKSLEKYEGNLVLTASKLQIYEEKTALRDRVIESVPSREVAIKRLQEAGKILRAKANGQGIDKVAASVSFLLASIEARKNGRPDLETILYEIGAGFVAEGAI